MDDGLLHRMAFKTWRGASGSRWPYQDELELGCTVEHAGYVLTWLCAFFGPATHVTAFAALAAPEKGLDDVPPSTMGPDLTVACIRFGAGPIARLTCSIVAPEDHAIRIFGEDGVLSTEDCWKPRSPVHLKKRQTFRGRTIDRPWSTTVKPLRDPRLPDASRRGRKVDFCLGPVDLARALAEGRAPKITARFACHIAEITLAIHHAMRGPNGVALRTSFDPMTPMPWAT
jgi:predicted dehydrogenase